MLALSIRQPYAELILRGVKTVELRSRATRLIGEPFLIYASKQAAADGTKQTNKIWSTDLAMPADPRLPWLLELAEQVKRIEPNFHKLADAIALLPKGLIVGSARIERCERLIDPSAAAPGLALYAWHLTDVKRFAFPRVPSGRPQPVWWREGLMSEE